MRVAKMLDCTIEAAVLQTITVMEDLSSRNCTHPVSQVLSGFCPLLVVRAELAADIVSLAGSQILKSKLQTCLTTGISKTLLLVLTCPMKLVFHASQYDTQWQQLHYVMECACSSSQQRLTMPCLLLWLRISSWFCTTTLKTIVSPGLPLHSTDAPAPLKLFTMWFPTSNSCSSVA